jgi:hypothetical protein
MLCPEVLPRLGANRQYREPSFPLVLDSNVRAGTLAEWTGASGNAGNLEGTVTGRPDVICLKLLIAKSFLEPCRNISWHFGEAVREKTQGT